MPLEGLLFFPCLPFPPALWAMHLLTSLGRAAWGCLPGSWEQQSTDNYRLKERSLTGGLVQILHFIGEHRLGKVPSYCLPGGN